MQGISEKDAEAQCFSVQFDALERMGRDNTTLRYIKDSIAEYWKIDYGNG